eukprot:3782112-Amphidinium_carterae.1
MKHSVYLGFCDTAQTTRRRSPRHDCERFHPKTALSKVLRFEHWTILRMEVVKETSALGCCMTSCGECGGGECRGGNWERFLPYACSAKKTLTHYGHNSLHGWTLDVECTIQSQLCLSVAQTLDSEVRATTHFSKASRPSSRCAGIEPASRLWLSSTAAASSDLGMGPVERHGNIMSKLPTYQYK